MFPYCRFWCRRWIRSAVLLVIFLTIPLAALASQVRPLNLEQMTQRADRIFHGRCVNLRTVRDPDLGQWVTYVTFAPQRGAKGGVRGGVTIKLLGDQEMGARLERAVEGLPRFRRGEEVVLFLYGDSHSGLTSPVGFGQGKFTVFQDKQGQPLAINGFSNENLFRGLSREAERKLQGKAEKWRGRKGVPPDALLDMVDALQNH